MSDPKVGGSSPWGVIQHVETRAAGIVSVQTAEHGGIHLSAELNAAMPKVFRNARGWYEEDCEWAKVALVHPHAFTEASREAAYQTVKHWMPDAYEAWAGVILQPGESRKKDERDFLKAHTQDWLVTSACGEWHDAVPAGWVGTYARPGAALLDARGASAAPTRHFLVPKDEYDSRRDTFGIFVCDPERHPAWDPAKPKAEQVLEVAADQDEPESPRP